MEINRKKILRGDVYLADLFGNTGSEQGGQRPVLVIQNNIGNTFSPTVIVACITKKIKKANLPTHIEASAELNGLDYDSVVLMEQLRTIDKARLFEKVAHLDEKTMEQVNYAIMVSLGLIDRKVVTGLQPYQIAASMKFKNSMVV
ncbi:type II toxin-antitoxin system PemK/MazF family toxin [Brevibacillus laterosporus]|uniref:Type II toxin-antitoxin system PemK/MazF family toxin n=1 Tax=Brevibacillus laterosporus TaxID=1465 RepID=A0A518VCH7_BRELA|nr:type II toxin-antitoxin system PemK/MazF family toxin [Brevibacillus laterosporus]